MESYSIFIAAITSMLIGYAWYSPALFGKQWAKLTGSASSKKDEKRPNQKKLLMTFFVSLIMAFCLKNLLVIVGINSMADAYWLALTLWAGFICPVLIWSVIWEQRSIRLFTINATYHVISIIIASVILVKF